MDQFDEATRVRTVRLFQHTNSSDHPAEQKELSTFIDNEQAQARVNSSIQTFTSMCWDKWVQPYLIAADTDHDR